MSKIAAPRAIKGLNFQTPSAALACPQAHWCQNERFLQATQEEGQGRAACRSRACRAARGGHAGAGPGTGRTSARCRAAKAEEAPRCSSSRPRGARSPPSSSSRATRTTRTNSRRRRRARAAEEDEEDEDEAPKRAREEDEAEEEEAPSRPRRASARLADAARRRAATNDDDEPEWSGNDDESDDEDVEALRKRRRKPKKKKAAIFKTKDERRAEAEAARRKAEAQKREDDARRAAALRSVETAAFGGGASNPFFEKRAAAKKPSQKAVSTAPERLEAPFAPTEPRAGSASSDTKADGLASSILEKPFPTFGEDAAPSLKPALPLTLPAENTEDVLRTLARRARKTSVPPPQDSELIGENCVNARRGLVEWLRTQWGASGRASLSDDDADFASKATAAGKEIIKNIPPFSANETITQVDPTAPFVAATFNLDLTPTQYYSDPVVGRDHVYVIALQKKLPAFVPAFAAVKELAMQRAQQQADSNTYREHMITLYTQVQQAVANGTSFADAIKTASLSLETLTPFNSEQPLEHPQAELLMERTYQLETAQLAAPIETEAGVLLTAVRTRSKADITGLNTQRPRIEASILQQKRANRISTWQAGIVAEAAIEIFKEEPES